MNILLTGSDGFIGSHLFYQLKEEHNVIGFDIKNGHDIMYSEFPKDIDLVIHLAGLSGVRDSLTRPTEYWKTNVIGTQRLFEHYKNTRIIYASSSTAHEPWKNPYAMSKYGMEQLEHFNCLGLRFTTVYGPGARNTMFIPLILNNAVSYVNVNHIRDFIHVDDVISAIESVMHINLRGVLDVGTGKGHKLIDIVDYFKLDYVKNIGNETERLNNTADTTILNNHGWKAKADLYKYIQRNRNVN